MNKTTQGLLSLTLSLFGFTSSLIAQLTATIVGAPTTLVTNPDPNVITQSIITFTGSNGTPPYTFNYTKSYTLNGVYNSSTFNVSTSGANSSMNVSLNNNQAGKFTFTLNSVIDHTNSTTQLPGTSVLITVKPPPPYVGISTPTTPAIFCGCGGTVPKAHGDNYPIGKDYQFWYDNAHIGTEINSEWEDNTNQVVKRVKGGLSQNGTIWAFEIDNGVYSDPSEITISIYNMTGRTLPTLTSNRTIVLQSSNSDHNSYSINGCAPISISGTANNGGSIVWYDQTNTYAGKILAFGLPTLDTSASSPFSSSSSPPIAFEKVNFPCGNVTIPCYPVYALANISVQSGAACSVLPVEIVSFDAAKKGSSIELYWQTASEINLSEYQIERSSDGSAFVAIGGVKSNENSASALKYGFLDENPFNGVNYYRLKIIDLDASFAYSNIASVRNSDPQKIGVFPNPFSQSLSLSLGDTHQSGQGILEVLDALGRIILSETENYTTGNELITIPTNHWTPGIYFVKWTQNNTVFSQRVLKQ